MYTTHCWLSILEGCLLVALGIHILNANELMISGTAGAGLIVKYLTDLSFGVIFFTLNLPFYWLAFRYMGSQFTLRTFCSITLLSVLTELMQRYLSVTVEPVFAAVLGGLLIGFGLIILFRHHASLGGLNILAMYLERRFNIHPGRTTFIGDLIIASVGFCVLPVDTVAVSMIAFVVMSSVVGRYHKPPQWTREQGLGLVKAPM
jgi:uncharacterized membrane-anchored protein YitT (DUF2179 family)